MARNLEFCYTPGTPFFAKLKMTVFFRSALAVAAPI
jgi:hypothetical protein